MAAAAFWPALPPALPAAQPRAALATRCRLRADPAGAQQRRQRAHLAAATGGGGGGPPLEGADAAFAAAEACMALFLKRKSAEDLDALVSYLPDSVLDRLLERKQARRAAAEQADQGALAAGSGADDGEDELRFEELVALSQPADIALDAYAARGLINAPPRSAAMRSNLRLAPDRFLARFSVVAASGEEMVITVDLQLEDSLQPKYRGLQVVKRWFLRGLTGESAHPGEVPSKPAPRWGPEAVVQAQLEALQAGDASGVFRFASPTNQAATGPVERFRQMLQTDAYRPLLHHQSAEVLRVVQMTRDNTWLIVGVRSDASGQAVYSWSVKLQGLDAGPEYDRCWMTEAVQPISQVGFRTGL